MASNMQLAREIRFLSEPKGTYSPVIPSLCWKTVLYLPKVTILPFILHESFPIVNADAHKFPFVIQGDPFSLALLFPGNPDDLLTQDETACWYNLPS